MKKHRQRYWLYKSDACEINSQHYSPLHAIDNHCCPLFTLLVSMFCCSLWNNHKLAANIMIRFLMTVGCNHQCITSFANMYEPFQSTSWLNLICHYQPFWIIIYHYVSHGCWLPPIIIYHDISHYWPCLTIVSFCIGHCGSSLANHYRHPTSSAITISHS